MPSKARIKQRHTLPKRNSLSDKLSSREEKEMGRTEVPKVAVGMERWPRRRSFPIEKKEEEDPPARPPSRFWGADIPDQWFRNQLHILPTTNGRKETYFWLAAGRKARTVTQCLCNCALQQRWPARKYIKVAWSSDCRRDPCNPPFRSTDAQYRNTQACTKTGSQTNTEINSSAK